MMSNFTANEHSIGFKRLSYYYPSIGLLTIQTSYTTPLKSYRGVQLIGLNSNQFDASG
jgi:hypothetical protein